MTTTFLFTYTWLKMSIWHWFGWLVGGGVIVLDILVLCTSEKSTFWTSFSFVHSGDGLAWRSSMKAERRTDQFLT